MIKVDSSTRIPSVSEALGILNENNKTMPMFADFDKVMMNICYLQQCIAEVKKPLSSVIGLPTKTDLSGNLKAWILSRHKEGCFNRVKTGISVDKESIETAIESGGLDDDEKLVIQLYQK